MSDKDSDSQFRVKSNNSDNKHNDSSDENRRDSRSQNSEISNESRNLFPIYFHMPEGIMQLFRRDDIETLKNKFNLEEFHIYNGNIPDVLSGKLIKIDDQSQEKKHAACVELCKMHMDWSTKDNKDKDNFKKGYKQNIFYLKSYVS